MTMTVITGPLHLFSETGTEGGSWAIQNDEFITPPPAEPTVKICATCRTIWDTVSTPEEPQPNFMYYDADTGGYTFSPDPIENNEIKHSAEEDSSFDAKWNRAHNDLSIKCYQHGHMWEWQEPHESWSYEGLVELKNGDKLEIFDPLNKDEVIDTIEVKLIDQDDQYAEDAKDARGWVIHSYPDPETIDFEQWNRYFFEGFRARLTWQD
jgi:hypothetical protein